VPGKLRVHELAKELGVTSKELLASLKEQGEFVKSASSTVEPPVVKKMRKHFGVDSASKGSAVPQPDLSGQPSGQAAVKPGPTPGAAAKKHPTPGLAKKPTPGAGHKPGENKHKKQSYIKRLKKICPQLNHLPHENS
jgi:translation initiation factor IF-2